MSHKARSTRCERAVGGWCAILAALAVATHPVAAQRSGGNGTIYMGNYASSISVVDEPTLTVTAQIPLKTGIPLELIPSYDRKRFYVLDARFEYVEIVDVDKRQSVGSFTLSGRDRKVRIWSMSIDPQDRFAVMLVKIYEKLTDRYEIGGPMLLRYDLTRRAVTDTIPWPDGRERDFAQMLFSTDGSLLYFFSDDIRVLETEGFSEVDRWAYADALEPGLGRFGFGFPSTFYEEPGYYTGLFRMTDPVQNRRLMGIARVNLDERSIDFSVLGPSESVSFALAPGRKKAYGLHQEVANYQFWTFDVEHGRVVKKTQFAGRPRMRAIASSNGELLYVYNAGNTIDVYDASTYQHLRTAQFDADMTSFVMFPPSQ
jgi:YVTN family beta-propeller protein